MEERTNKYEMLKKAVKQYEDGAMNYIELLGHFIENISDCHQDPQVAITTSYRNGIPVGVSFKVVGE